MSKLDNEVKIAEKLKFWEEQDQINKELIPRVVKNHEMITDLTYQFEKSLRSIASMQSNMDDFQDKMDKLYKQYQDILKEQGQQIQELKLKVNKFQQGIEDIKTNAVEVDKNTPAKEKTNNLFISIGVVVAIILSIAGIIL